MLRTTETHGTHQTAKERLIVLRGSSRDKPDKLERAHSTYSTQVLRRSKPGKLLS